MIDQAPCLDVALPFGVCACAGNASNATAINANIMGPICFMGLHRIRKTNVMHTASLARQTKQGRGTGQACADTGPKGATNMANSRAVIEKTAQI